MTHRIVILGGGTGGTLVANRLRRAYGPRDGEITVVDQDDGHVYQPGLLFVPFGLANPDEIVRPAFPPTRRRHQVRAVRDRPRRHRTRRRCTSPTDGSSRTTCSSSRPARVSCPRRPTASPASAGSTRSSRSTTSPGAAALAAKLARFEGGRARGERRRHADQVPGRAARVLLPRRLVLPRARHPRRVELTYVDAARRRVHEADRVEDARRSARREGRRARHRVQHRRGRRGRAAARRYDGRDVPFDLAVVVPLHGGAAYVGRSPGLGDELDFVPTDEHTLQVEGDARTSS